MNKIPSIKGATVTFPNGRTILNYGQEDEVIIESNESMEEIENNEFLVYMNDWYERGISL